MLVNILEKFGIFIFILSLVTSSQLVWANKYNYNDIELRITMGFVVSILLFSVLMRIFSARKINTDKISFALAFYIFGIYLNSIQELAILTLLVVIIYYSRNPSSNSWYGAFWGYNSYKVKFDIGQRKLRIVNNVKKDLNIFNFKYLFTELINCILYCKENSISNLIIDSSESEKLDGMIYTMFSNYDIEVTITKPPNVSDV